MVEITDHDSWLVKLDWLDDQGYDVQPYRIVRQALVRVSDRFGDRYSDGYGNICGYGNGYGYGDGHGYGDGDGDGYGDGSSY